MEENISFYKYIFQDDLYIIDETPVSNAKPEAKSLTNPPAAQPVPTIVEEPKPVVYLGQNAKGVLILVDEPDQTYLNEAELVFLIKIMEAGIGYTRQDIALVNLAHWPANQVFKEIDHRYLLTFGVDKNSLPDVGSAYQMTEVKGIKRLSADKLMMIEKDVAKKKLLWAALKSMFGI